MKVMTMLGARPQTIWSSGAIGRLCMSCPIPYLAQKKSQAGRMV